MIAEIVIAGIILWALPLIIAILFAALRYALIGIPLLVGLVALVYHYPDWLPLLWFVAMAAYLLYERLHP
jgi:hypothetical protein